MFIPLVNLHQLYFHIFFYDTGTKSLRHTSVGSWFVQGIAEVFLSWAHQDDIHTLMTKVDFGWKVYQSI